jgi:hypothetical protein
VVAGWNDTEVARRWLMLCPVRKDDEGNAEEPNEVELNSIRNDPQKLATIRLRLSDIGWWMRLLCQHIAVRANNEDQEVGKFWQSRFRAVRLLDEAALLACAAYVDLNPIRAQQTKNQKAVVAAGSRSGSPAKAVALPAIKPADRFLSPITINERSDAKLGPHVSQSGHRCSDKGFLAMSVLDYVSLLDWTARQIARGKRGATSKDVPAVFQRLGFEPTTWCKLVEEFGQMFRTVAGRPQTVDATRSRLNQRRFNLGGEARQLLTTAD